MTRALISRVLPSARRCKWFVAIVLLSLGLGEWYPFSNFPMYASLGPNTWYVYVTDGADQPLATNVHFGGRTMALRKVFSTRRAKLEMSADCSSTACDAAAGRHALEMLLRYGRRARDAPPLPARLRLWRTVVERRDGRIERQRDLLAELAVP